VSRAVPRVGVLLRARRLVHPLVAIAVLPLLLAATAAARVRTSLRRLRGARARLVWGPVPIINIKYWSEAMRLRGYESHTCVNQVMAINERADFDRHYDEFLPEGIAFDPLRAYVVFLWVLASADVYLCYFDGGFLANTPLRGLELPLLRAAGKRIIVSPYGSDIAVPGHLGLLEQALLRDYPGIAANGKRVRRRVLSFARWASLIVRNYQFGFLPRWDVTWPTELAIDAELWRPAPPGDDVSDRDGRSGEVIVVHASNHRHIKGTDALITTVDALREEGLRVRLELIEKRPNAEVRAAVEGGDVVADQFLIGYALFAIEGMAAGKPVLSALSGMAPDLRENLLQRGLPIVDADLSTLKARLRELIENPQRRKELGEAGRRFVLEHHSYEAVGAVFAAIIDHTWHGAPLPSELIDTGGSLTERATAEA
jgi:glycosyltransferase involved in cell wall biosynthesis